MMMTIGTMTTARDNWSCCRAGFLLCNRCGRALELGAMTTAPDIFANAPLVLASRASALALAQSEIVRDGLAPLNTDIRGMTTRGDRILDRSLADAGGKGLFVKELERRLLDGECDAAVHSMKDMGNRLCRGHPDRRGPAARGPARRAGRRL